MKVVSVTRLFSGLETSFINKSWNPTGVPTIYKIIEKLDSECDQFIPIYTFKDSFSKWDSAKSYQGYIEGLKNPITILRGKKRFPKFLGHRIRVILREIFQIAFCMKVIFFEKPDIIYVDHANSILGALFSRFTKTPVIFRVMGVYPVMRSALEKKTLSQKIMAFAYRSPFHSLICTQDGSGIEPWLKEAIHPKTRQHTLINGVDMSTPDKYPKKDFPDLPTNKTIFLFVGKLEILKGADSFIDAFLLACKKANGSIHALVVGDGSLNSVLKKKVNESDYSKDVTFSGRLPHQKILNAHAVSDVYISLNKLGNLSVANLEAMRFGQCMIFPKSQPSIGIDVPTDELIPEDTAMRIESSDSIEELSELIIDLSFKKERITSYKNKMKVAAGKFIPTWSERIDKEFEILSSIK